MIRKAGKMHIYDARITSTEEFYDRLGDQIIEIRAEAKECPDTGRARELRGIADWLGECQNRIDILLAYEDRCGPLDDEPDNPYRHAATPFADNH